MDIGTMLMRRRLRVDSSPFEENRWYAFRMIPCEVIRGVHISDRFYAAPLSELTGRFDRGSVIFCVPDEVCSFPDGLYSVTADGSSRTGDAIYLWKTVSSDRADAVCLICAPPAIVCGTRNEYPDFGFRDGYLYIRERKETKK